jgi:hypothetical protein
VNNHADAVPVVGAQDLLPPEGLTWGVKRSFVKYLTSLPDGAVAAVEGATVLESGFFNFPSDGGGFDPATGTGILRFRGDVRLEGHFGMMFVQIANPWIEFQPDAGALTVALGEPGDEGAERIPLVTFDTVAPQVIGESLVWQAVDTRLSRQGSDVFNHQYGTGQAMDPLSIRVPAAGSN